MCRSVPDCLVIQFSIDTFIYKRLEKKLIREYHYLGIYHSPSSNEFYFGTLIIRKHCNFRSQNVSFTSFLISHLFYKCSRYFMIVLQVILMPDKTSTPRNSEHMCLFSKLDITVYFSTSFPWTEISLKIYL